MRYLGTIFIFLLAFPALIIAQQYKDCREHVFPTNVVDLHGQQVSDLTSEQFRAIFLGQPATVISAEFQSRPQRILMLVDVSDSMSDDPKQWQLVRLVVDDMVSYGPFQAQLALVTFSDTVEIDVRFGQNRDAVRGAIFSFKPRSKTASNAAGKDTQGGTAFNDAILEAAKMFGSPQPGDMIYAITDGYENESKNSSAKVLPYLEQRGIRLFAAVIHNRNFMPLYSQAGGPELVAEDAEKTGGSQIVLETGSPDAELNRAKNRLRQLYDLMASFYLIHIELPKEPDKPRELKLTVASISAHKKGMMVLYPQNIFPCPPQIKRSIAP